MEAAVPTDPSSDMATSSPAPPAVLDCPVYEEGDDDIIGQFSFWLEGVAQCCVALGGLIGNFISAIILSRDEMRNSFNLLLIALICFDSWYLFGSILESFRRTFDMSTDLHTWLFPYLLYPAQSISMSASIFMTVGIALERYIAVHYPIDYNQSMNSPEACRRRLLKYVIPVLILSILFNVPKFMEATVHLVPVPTPAATEAALAAAEEAAAVNATMASAAMEGASAEASAGSEAESSSPAYYLATTAAAFNTTYDYEGFANGTEACEDYAEYLATFNETVLCRPQIKVTELRKNPFYAIYYNNWTRLLVLGIIPAAMLIYFNYKIYKDIQLRQSRRRQSMSQVTINHQARRRQEDNLAVVFMGIVGVFLLCHFLRVFLNLHEMVVIRHAMECRKQGERSFPMWAIIMTSFSHILLVFNSSTNMIIYCSLNLTFREHFMSMIRDFYNKLLCVCCIRVGWLGELQASESRRGSTKSSRGGSGRSHQRNRDGEDEDCVELTNAHGGEQATQITVVVNNGDAQKTVSSLKKANGEDSAKSSKKTGGNRVKIVIGGGGGSGSNGGADGKNGASSTNGTNVTDL